MTHTAGGGSIDLSVSRGKNVPIIYNYNALFSGLCNFMYFLRIFHHLAGMFYHRCTAQLSPDNAEYIATTGPLSITVHQGSEPRNLAQL